MKGVSKLEPLFLKPVFHEKIWGGTQLKSKFGYDIPSNHTGECWAISAHKHGPATVENGEYKGIKLNELWNTHRELFGNQKGDVFPLLTKILDANQDLSVQVHPDDKYAAKHEHELGKTECWYVIDAKPGAYLYYGHFAKSRKELADLIHSGNWKKLFRKVPVKTGDFFFVPSGTIHALGAGIMVLETQQSSDTTYRVYDFDRIQKSTGKKRELHIQQSIDVTNVPHVDPKLDIKVKKVDDAKITTFLDKPISKHFAVQKIDLNGKVNIKRKGLYTLASVLDGQGYLEINNKKYNLKKGQHFILPYQIDQWTFSGKMILIDSWPL